jgi:glucose-6-phosphate 1-epimerase
MASFGVYTSLRRQTIPPMPIIDAIGQGGLPCLDLSNRFGTARVYLLGAHVTSWTPAGGSEVLWLSAHSNFAAGKPIRGGIPVCYPWFGAHPSDAAQPAHGFARLKEWSVQSREDLTDGRSRVSLALRDDASTLAAWPHAFHAVLTVTLGAELDVELATTNTGSAPLVVNEALHTYFAVQDIQHASVNGLTNIAYLDKAGGGCVERAGESSDVRFSAETDRHYNGVAGPHVVADDRSGRRIEVAKRGSSTTVVWNPWIAKSAKMPDFGDHEWPGMVCVEAANAGADQVSVAAGAKHSIATTLKVLK